MYQIDIPPKAVDNHGCMEFISGNIPRAGECYRRVTSKSLASHIKVVIKSNKSC